jgi:cytochrome bd-type quinol oxidase subunit 2
MTTSLLAEWDNFYVITGSSAAGLTGLTFVVIALSADAKRVNETGLRAFVTPTIVHFGTVLALAAYLSMPHQTVLSLSLGLGAAGAAGILYVAVIAAAIWRIASDSYTPVREDWVWNVILPSTAYGVLLLSAFLIWHKADASMYGIAAVSVLLMFIGIHNAWDVAVWNSMRKQRDSTKA